jgi:hypothetical protein
MHRFYITKGMHRFYITKGGLLRKQGTEVWGNLPSLIHGRTEKGNAADQVGGTALQNGRCSSLISDGPSRQNISQARLVPLGIGGLELHDSRHVRLKVEEAIIYAIHQAAPNGKQMSQALIQQLVTETALLQQAVSTLSEKWCMSIRAKIR